MSAEAGPAAGGSVLRRKAAGAAPAVALAAMTPGRAFRLAVAKSGEAALGVPVAAGEVEENAVSPDTAAAGLPDPGLYLQVAGEEGRGVAVLCPQALAAVIEALTMATVLAAEAEPRGATATDAAMAMGWIQQILAGAAALSDVCDAPVPAGHLTGSTLPGPEALSVYLSDLPARRWEIGLDFGGGAKAGRLWLILPDAAACGTGHDSPAEWRRRLEGSVLGARAELEAVLGRISLPIERITALAPDEMLSLGQTSLDDLTLMSPCGTKVAEGRLGRAGASRAVRLRIGGRPGQAAIEGA